MSYDGGMIAALLLAAGLSFAGPGPVSVPAGALSLLETFQSSKPPPIITSQKAAVFAAEFTHLPLVLID